MYECQLCGSISLDIAKVCDNCGYSFEVKEITDGDRTRAYHMRLSKSQNWAAVIRFKKMINDIQIKKHGYSATYSPSGAWSKSKTAALLGEGSVTTSEDIRLAEAVDEYPQLLNCNTKSEANKRLKEIQTGMTYKGDRPTFQFEKDLQKHLNSNWSETPFFKEWKLQEKGALKEGRYVFVEKRIYEEMIIFRLDGEKFSGLRWNLMEQSLLQEAGRYFDKLVFEITALPENDWEELKAEFEGPQGHGPPGFDEVVHERKRQEKVLRFTREFWFDITSFYGQGLVITDKSTAKNKLLPPESFKFTDKFKKLFGID